MPTLAEQVAGRTSIIDEVLTGSMEEGEVLSGVELLGCTLRDAQLAGATLAGVRLEAVSYTHLTLPTIHVECRSRWSPYH